MVYTLVDSDLGRIIIARTEDGLNRVHFLTRDRALPDYSQWNRAEDDPLLVEAGNQLKAYFPRRLTEFSLPLDPWGTGFQKRVWAALVTIPHGQTRTYKQLAVEIGKPTACRAVGAANGQNKISIIVPCHRLIGSNGSLIKYAGGLDRKRYLLDLERSD